MGEALPPKPGERIPRRSPPAFEELDESHSVMSGIMHGGLLNVAVKDTNQYGPHAMIALLGIVSSITGLLLLLMWKFI